MTEVSSGGSQRSSPRSSDEVAVSAPDVVYVAWTVFQRRQVSMAQLVEMECVFLPVAIGGSVNKVTKACRYARLMHRTMTLLRRRKPAVVWLQIPQVPLLWAALLYRRLFDTSVRLVADCHNAMFVQRWARVPFGLSSLGRCDLVLVHNDAVQKAAAEMGVPTSRTVVLEDVPPTPAPALSSIPVQFAGRPRPWVLFPGSFAADEPIREVLEAACLSGVGTIVITGRRENAAAGGHDIGEVGPNVVMPGYLQTEDFDALLCHCDVVLALTKVDGIQLSVCNEALGFGKPMVMSDTSLLRALFGDAAVLVRSEDPADIAAGIRAAYQDIGKYSSASLQLAERRRTEWLVKYDTCRRLLST